MAAREAEPFDYEMECAKEAGVMAVADLLNKREEEAKRMPRSEAPAPALAPQPAPVAQTRGQVQRRNYERWAEALALMERWGAHEQGDHLTTPLPGGPRSQFAPAGGGTAGDGFGLAQYIRTTPGFHRVRQILVWRFVRGERVRDWPNARGRRQARAFIRLLGMRMIADPYRPARRPLEMCEADRMPSKQSDAEWAKAGKVERQKASSHHG